MSKQWDQANSLVQLMDAPLSDFFVVYVGECGEEYEMLNASLPYIRLYCDACEASHKFERTKITYGLEFDEGFIQHDN